MENSKVEQYIEKFLTDMGYKNHKKPDAIVYYKDSDWVYCNKNITERFEYIVDIMVVPCQVSIDVYFAVCTEVGLCLSNVFIEKGLSFVFIVSEETPKNKDNRDKTYNQLIFEIKEKANCEIGRCLFLENDGYIAIQ